MCKGDEKRIMGKQHDVWLNQGIQRHQAGDARGAARFYERVLQGVPNHPQALGLLGTARLQQGQVAEAVPVLRQAVALEPGNVETQYHLGMALHLLGDLEGACETLQRSVSINPDFVPAHSHLGEVLLERGYVGNAVTSFKHAVRLQPDNLDVRARLGVALHGHGQMAEAREVLEQILKRDPNHVAAIVGFAALLSVEGDFQAAHALLKPHINAHYENVNLAMVFANLSTRVGEEERAKRWLRDLLKRKDVSSGNRRLMEFRLGDLLDRDKDYDSAFDHYQKGNALDSNRFDPEQHRRWVDDMIQVFSAERIGRLPKSFNANKLPVFIVGMPRSGTSLVEQIIASHPEAAGAGELSDIINLSFGLKRMLRVERDYPLCVPDLDRRILDEQAERFIKHLREVSKDARRISDKMPHNALHLGLISLLFPGSRVIHCVRDPLDTCLSSYFKCFSGHHAYASNLEHLGGYYREYQRLMAHWREVLRLPMLEVRYEELVQNQEAKSREIIEFLGLEWDDACLRFYETKRTVATASYDQVNKPIYKSSMARWRRYEAHLQPLIQALGVDTGTD